MLYQRDGLNLKRDLKSLETAERIAADKNARANLAQLKPKMDAADGIRR